MQKIISLFQRNYDGDRLVRDEVVPGAEWVLVGEGVATVKYDGTSCMVRGGKLFKRYDAKPGRTPPAGFEQSGEPDPITGRVQGWVPVGDGPEDRWHREAFHEQEDGTYELVGPKVQGNPYGHTTHILIRHGKATMHHIPLTFEGIRDYLARHALEGLVWHHPDGRMVKIKRKDFGLPWPVKG
jgi:hypothetical protein